ncbi:DctP family TRAP transporter solute-binding subunit [Bacillus sp. CMF12]|uniref:TRAP transporter substrate-binding protein n=1 Tax=Bacillaceae TaxID=186817 RepID=UPI001FB50ECC|nr:MULTISPECIES: DctP family TRAP transporter solute-binding subunit [Bacillaceae]UOE57260.1 DctP family TRAP transporter solute-binding subunit [Cytobacillus oceanisediminis]USK51755.1 DctP family TRAP transporter solute-binding subunit [Bacillus sp. CMF12]
MRAYLSILSILFLLFVSGCSSNVNGKEPEAEYVLRLGHLQTETHPYHKGALKFKELVEEKSNGRIRIDIFPSSQLGNGRDQIEGAQIGSIHFHIGSVAPVTNFAPKFNLLNLPYLFESREHAFRVLDGEIGKEIASDLENRGLINLGYMENGWRHMTNNKKPIKTSSDAAKLKLRVQESPPYISFIKALGSTPVPVPFGELYTALEQKVVDGQENPLAQIYLNKFQEVQSYLTLTAHNYDAAVFLMSKTTYDTLPEELQKAVSEASAEAVDYERKVALEDEKKLLEDLKKTEIEIEENPDLDSFREAVKQVYEEYEETLGKELFDKIESLK